MAGTVEVSTSFMNDENEPQDSSSVPSMRKRNSATSLSLQVPADRSHAPTTSKGRRKRLGASGVSTGSISSGSSTTSNRLRAASTGDTLQPQTNHPLAKKGTNNGALKRSNSDYQPAANASSSRSSKPKTNNSQSSQEARGRKPTLFARAGNQLRSLSRSRSRSSRASSAALNVSLGSSQHGDTDSSCSANSSGQKSAKGELIITVTSCKSDAYHDQRAPGATSKLPRRAPTALKVFHELALGIKDAYEACGMTPRRPAPTPPVSVVGGSNKNGDGVNANGATGVNNSGDSESVGDQTLSDAEREGQNVLFEFMGNLDFLLALVDEVAIDTATRGALKEDTTFKGLRDVIKKCNKVLESMLVRRERKYTLMFRIVRPTDTKMLKKIAHWNARVEKALGGVTQDDDEIKKTVSDDASDAGSEMSSISTSSARSSVSTMLRRGRELLPSAGKVRARRATPTPRLRRKRDSANSDDASVGSSSAAEDGYASDSVPMTTENLAKLQLSLDVGEKGEGGGGATGRPGVPPNIEQLQDDKKKKGFSLSGMIGGQVKPMKPKDELLDVIRGLRTEQMRAREAVGSAENSINVLEEIKSNFTPKAEIPSAVPKLPTEYIHRHRLMKQVVNCLLDRAGPRDTDDESPFANTITCITSRHSDKAGNGKTTLAVAAIQTVEVREFFSDGIAWIHLGRVPLGEREIRRLYEQLYDQLLGGDEEEADEEEAAKDDDSGSNSSSGTNDEKEEQQHKDPPGRAESGFSNSGSEFKLAKSRRSFQGGELEGMKEDLGRLLLTKKVLICLDDACRMEDAKWFLFGTRSDSENNFEDTPHRILITTRIPGLVGPGITHEVFVRIFSEHEAVKLLLTAAGRRPNGLPKVSPVFTQARIIVKGCGNSPLALRIAGGMLRSSNRNWTLSSPAWKSLVEQCRTSLEEASKIRSFANSVQRLVDLSFATVTDLKFRSCLRQCFVAFALVFNDTDSLKVGKGISRAVVIRLFAMVSRLFGGDLKAQATPDDLADQMDNAATLLDTLETMNLLQRAGHELSKSSTTEKKDGKEGNEEMNNNSSSHKCYSMHESIKAIAEDMAKRKTEAFAPLYDEFNSFVSKSDNILEVSNLPFPFDECMVMMLTGEIATVAQSIQSSPYDRWNIEEYIAENLPLHLVRAKMLRQAAGTLIDQDFCSRRVTALGPIESTRRHVSDLNDLRRSYASISANHSQNINQSKSDGSISPPDNLDFNIVSTIQEGSTCIIDEVARHSLVSPKNLNLAICLSTIGEGLIKARQPRDASQRLEEAANLYRDLLGRTHIDVARAVSSVAKSLVKLNEARVALIKFGEASSIYEECNFSHHFDAIANLQGMANLFVTSGDFQAATALYENVINRRQSVHGEFSVATAKTINDYAVILAKNGRMDDALARYEMARVTYERALDGLPSSMSWLNHGESAAKCGFDTALINLNIASIKSKKGDVQGAITSYEKGVQGLRKYKEDLDMAGDETGKNKNSSHMRHLVSALGRIGSLKLKQNDKNGALEAYASLFKEVDSDSPVASRLEKAKAHIKCATIYRQSGDREDNKHAILHLREALNMYTELYGTKHKDTVAVATSLQQWLDEEHHARS